MNGFFALRSSRDMFAKLEREYRRLLAEPGIDNVFNFFVTAYHIKDYLEKEGLVDEKAVVALYEEGDMQTCEHLCNKGKHMVLSKGDFHVKGKARPDPVANVTSGAYGCFSLGTVTYGGAPPWCIYYPDKKTRIEILPLANRIMSRLAAFFSDHQL